VIDVRRLRTLLFDVDGTLIDSNAAHAEAWTQSLREHGVRANLTEIRRLIGMGGDKLLPAAAHVSHESVLGLSITERKKSLFAALVARLEPTNGARALLEYLRDQGIALVTASSADDQEMAALLKRAGVHDLFPVFASGAHAKDSKPDPDIVEAALAKSGARHELTVMIGDTPYDIEAAHRAGIKAIALRCGGYWSDRSLWGAVEVHDDPQALLIRWRALTLPWWTSRTSAAAS
jgi:HAD superfamily hydrolase (TIGR01509 family)